MSNAANHERKQVRQLCGRCRDRKARFQYRGTVRADRDHTLCFECYRAERNRRRAGLLADVPPASPLRFSFPAAANRELTAAQVEHRSRMLAHLRNGRA